MISPRLNIYGTISIWWAPLWVSDELHEWFPMSSYEYDCRIFEDQAEKIFRERKYQVSLGTRACVQIYNYFFPRFSTTYM